MKYLFSLASIFLLILSTSSFAEEDYTYLACGLQNKNMIKKILSEKIKINTKKIEEYSSPVHQNIGMYLLKVSKAGTDDSIYKHICSEFYGHRNPWRRNDREPPFMPYSQQGDKTPDNCVKWNVSDEFYTRFHDMREGDEGAFGRAGEIQAYRTILKIRLRRTDMNVLDRVPSSYLSSFDNTYTSGRRAYCSISDAEEHRLLKEKFSKINDIFREYRQIAAAKAKRERESKQKI